MGKALFWISIFVGMLLLTRILARKAAQPKSEDKSSGSAQGFSKKNATLASSEQMVRCEHCGIHLPTSEAMRIENHIWCSTEHAKLGVRPHA